MTPPLKYHPFYKNLFKIDELLMPLMKIDDLENGLILVNGQIVDTNLQQEMLSNAFLESTATNLACEAWWNIFTDIGITREKSIPLLRDIPFRTRNQTNVDGQIEAFAQFLYQTLLPQQWTNNFPQIRHNFEREINQIIGQADLAQSAQAHQHITTDPENNLPLESGGYYLYRYNVLGIDLWIRAAENDTETSIKTAVEQSLNENVNTQSIVQKIIMPMLAGVSHIAFNIRGLSRTCHSLEQVEKAVMMGAGGGHQSFLILDRTRKSIYAINDTISTDPSSIEALKEDYLYFKDQIDCFLALIGDTQPYQLILFNGRSRQTDALIRQPCGVSQYLDYLAIDAGVPPENIMTETPHHVFNLLYLLQYASSNNHSELNEWLFELAKQFRLKLAESMEIVTNTPVVEASHIKQKKHSLVNQIRLAAKTFKQITQSENHIYYQQAMNQLLAQINESLSCYERQDNISDAELRKQLLTAISEARNTFIKDPTWSMWIKNLYIWVRDCFKSIFTSQENLLFHYQRSHSFEAYETLSETINELTTASPSH